MNWASIEKAAEKILRDADIIKPVIKADRIAEFYCDVDIDWLDLDEICSEGKVLAAISFAHQKIYMNCSCESELTNNPGRMNFTIAHELGHWFLHKHLAQETLPGFEGNFLICRGVNGTGNNTESQANRFAAYLLMPKKFIESAIQNFNSPMDDSDIEQLARRFCVSKQAMRIRLIDELHFLHHADGVYYRSEVEFLEAGGQLKLL